MKNFIYLDTELTNSIIAQADHGVIVDTTYKVSNEAAKGKTKKKSKNNNLSAQANLGIGKIFGIEAAIEEYKTESNTESSSVISEEIVNKALYDAAFDIACNCIKLMDAKENSDECGQYVRLKRVFDFVDFECYCKMFEENGIMDYSRKINEKEINDKIATETGNLNRAQSRQIKKDVDKIRQEALIKNKDEYDEMANIVYILRNILPYDKMMVSYDGYVVPLNERFFRTDAKNVGIMYGGEMECVGMITNIILTDNVVEERTPFTSIQNAINSILQTFLPTDRKEIAIVQPIAVYYENDDKVN